MVALTCASGVVGFLSERDPALQVFALERLNEDIESVWTQVTVAIGQIEALYEDESFSHRELAALVLSKIYYNLQEYNEAMLFALGAGEHLDIETADEYEETILAKCIDTYISLCALHNPPKPLSSAHRATSESGESGIAGAAAAATAPTTPFTQSHLPSKSLLSRADETGGDVSGPGGGNAGIPGAHPHPLTLSAQTKKSLQRVIRRIFESCYRAGAYRQVLGIAVEARNLDVLRETILRASQDEKKGKGTAKPGQTDELMEYLLDLCLNVVQERGLRNQILKLNLDLVTDIPNPDYFAIARCVVYLDQHALAADKIKELIGKGDGTSLAIAYQIAFDLYDNGTQEFLHKVMEELPETEEDSAAAAAAASEEEPKQMNGNAPAPGSSDTEGEAASRTDRRRSAGEDGEAPATTVLPSRTKPKAADEAQRSAFARVRSILRGTTSIELNLEFLYRSSRSDKAILNRVRDALEARNSIFHTSITFANAFMNAGTTVDSFFRENLEWLGKAVNWSKFTATAALGVIHRGNLSQGQKLLEPYLPKENAAASQGSAYSQGGSLYALGLIYANHGTDVLEYLQRQFKATNEEVVQHGGALGLGVAGMATGSEQLYEDLKNVLYSDSAINGEAVGLAMGLVMLGTGSVRALEDMIQYAHDTQHEKIVRGLAMGMALIMYGRQEGADELINGLLEDADPALRYGGIMTLALAYCGSGSNKAVRKLLHVAVSDVSDDVRRMAVMSLGFVLFRKPNSVPRMVELLAESYNPHVRYGATMALGIACAGTGLDEAVALLEPMAKDSVDFVRQGALIALAMILVQQNDATNPKVSAIRKQLQKSIADRHEDAMAKFGCALALGIIDAGGRNCTIGLQTQTGNLNMAAIVGMAVFTQYWYWFPLTHFLSLAFTPTAIIGVDKDLQVPAFTFWSNTRPSLFDYPPEQEVKAEEQVEKVKTAVLSTTAQARRRRQAREKERGMDVDSAVPTTPKPVEGEEEAGKMEVDEEGTPAAAAAPAAAGDGAGAGTSRKKAEKEKVGYEVENMSRVLPGQIRFISFPHGGRYEPVKKPTGGVILLLDHRPDEPKSLLELKARKKTTPPAAAPGPAGGLGGGARGGMAGAGQLQDADMLDLSSLLQGGSGARDAAGVLTAVDEDEEGGAEAPVPEEFEVEDSEGEDEDDEEEDGEEGEEEEEDEE